MTKCRIFEYAMRNLFENIIAINTTDVFAFEFFRRGSKILLLLIVVNKIEINGCKLIFCFVCL